MPTGKVKWFNNAKGYGFILPGEASNDEDLFVHYSSINMEGYKTLKAGQLVNYDILQGPKGLHAVNITALIDEEIEAYSDAHEHAQHTQPPEEVSANRESEENPATP